MVKELMHDPVFLAQKSAPATAEDAEAARDLMDTLLHHKDGCVGMAANMIGVCKRIIAFEDDGKYMLMYNPQIVKKSDPYMTKESCLSLLGGPRPTKRYGNIKVKYETSDFKIRLKTFTGFTAQIIQHEIDHLNGVLI